MNKKIKKIKFGLKNRKILKQITFRMQHENLRGNPATIPKSTP